MLSLSLLIVASLSHLLSAPPKASWGASHGILPLGAGGTHESDLQPHRHKREGRRPQHCERALVLAKCRAASPALPRRAAASVGADGRRCLGRAAGVDGP